MVPEIRLMMRVERDAEQQRHPTPEERSDYALFELSYPAVHVQRIGRSISHFTVGNQPVKVQQQGTLRVKVRVLNGLKASALGLSWMRMGFGDMSTNKQERSDFLRAAVDCDVAFFDTRETFLAFPKPVPNRVAAPTLCSRRRRYKFDLQIQQAIFCGVQG